MTLPTRSNGQKIDASWYNSIKTDLEAGKLNTAIKTGDYTLTSSDRLITVDTSSADITITLPPITDNDGLNYIIKKTDANAHDVILDADGAETIDGAANVTLSNQYNYTWVVSGANEWHVTSLEQGALQTHAALTATHGVAGAIVGTTDAQVLTNKTFDNEIISKHIATPANPSAGYMKFYPKTDNKFYTLNSVGSEIEVGSGSGSGSGGTNYITNGDAESTTTGWTRYKNTAPGVAPDDFGGTPDAVNVTWTRSATAPLRGVGSFVWTVDAANNQGEGVYFEFTLENADLSRSMFISFEALTSSGVLDGDIRVYLVSSSDSFVTDFNVIETVPVELLVGTGAYASNAQTDATDTEYRLCIHQASTTATAETTKIDTITLGPSVINFGQPMTEWESYTPTFSHAITANPDCFRRRVGDSIHLSGYVEITGTGGATNFTFSLPSGLVIDTTKSKENGSTVFGVAQFLDGGLSRNESCVVRQTSTTFSFVVDEIPNGSLQADELANGDALSWSIIVPVVGWGVTAQLSDVNSARPTIVEYGSVSSQALTANVTDISFATKSVDTKAAWSGTVFTAQEKKYHSILGLCSFSGAVSIKIDLYKSTGGAFSQVKRLSTSLGAASTVYSFQGGIQLNKGDQISFRSNGNATANGGADAHWVSITTIQGNQQSMAGEKVHLYAYGTNTSVPDSGAETDITFLTIEKDTHGNFDGTSLTCGKSGLATVEAALFWLRTATANNQFAAVNIVKNTTTMSRGIDYSFNGQSALDTHTSVSFPVLKGDTIKVSGQHNIGSGNLVPTNDRIHTHLSIKLD